MKWLYEVYDYIFPFGYIEVPLRFRGKTYLRDHIVTVLQLGVFIFLCVYASFKLEDIGKITHQLIGKEKYRNNKQYLQNKGINNIERVALDNVFPMLFLYENNSEKKGIDLNLCEYFDKPDDDFDVQVWFNIYYYPNETATTMDKFQFQRRMECVRMSHYYYQDRITQYLRMDELSRIVINEIMDDQIIEGKKELHPMWAKFAEEHGINTKREVYLSATKILLDMRNYCKIWNEKGYRIKGSWVGNAYTVDSSFQQNAVKDVSNDMFTSHNINVFSFKNGYEPCKHIDLDAETYWKMLEHIRVHEILFKKVMVDSPVTLYDYFFDQNKIFYYHAADNVDAYGIKVEEHLWDPWPSNNYTIYVKL